MEKILWRFKNNIELFLFCVTLKCFPQTSRLNCVWGIDVFWDVMVGELRVIEVERGGSEVRWVKGNRGGKGGSEGRWVKMNWGVKRG